MYETKSYLHYSYASNTTSDAILHDFKKLMDLKKCHNFTQNWSNKSWHMHMQAQF